MAKDRTTENHITATINKDRRRATCKVNLICIPVALIASFFCPAGIPIWAFAWFVLFKTAQQSGSAVLLTGAAGEEKALSVLLRLPDEYTIFNQIQMPDERSRTGFREADFVVVGPNGIHIIENKDFRGMIVGDEYSYTWEICKVGRQGTHYSTSGRNPVRQVQVYVSLLSRILRNRGINAWITPLVSLSQDNGLDQISSKKVKVIKATDLCDIIQANNRNLTEEAMMKTLDIMEELRVGELCPGEECQAA
jgi:hypothetical protein